MLLILKAIENKSYYESIKTRPYLRTMLEIVDKFFTVVFSIEMLIKYENSVKKITFLK